MNEMNYGKLNEWDERKTEVNEIDCEWSSW